MNGIGRKLGRCSAIDEIDSQDDNSRIHEVRHFIKSEDDGNAVHSIKFESCPAKRVHGDSRPQHDRSLFHSCISSVFFSKALLTISLQRASRDDGAIAADFDNKADQGDPESKLRYGFRLYFGDRVAREKSLVAHYFHLCSDQGDMNAQ
jgi:hypothetical protein